MVGPGAPKGALVKAMAEWVGDGWAESCRLGSVSNLMAAPCFLLGEIDLLPLEVSALI